MTLKSRDKYAEIGLHRYSIRCSETEAIIIQLTIPEKLQVNVDGGPIKAVNNKNCFAALTETAFI